MAGGGFGQGPSLLHGTGPGFVDPFSKGAVSEAQGQSLKAMTNRYNQLGLGGSTAEAMDLGNAPSLTGGIPAEFQAILGELQNAALQGSGGGGGGGGGKGGGGGGKGALSALGGLKGV